MIDTNLLEATLEREALETRRTLGLMSDDDNMAVHCVPPLRQIMFLFSKEVTWISFTPEEIETLIGILQRALKEKYDE
jgi:hypothetical protein